MQLHEVAPELLFLGEVTQYLHFTANLLGLIRMAEHVFDVFHSVEEPIVLALCEVHLSEGPLTNLLDDAVLRLQVVVQNWCGLCGALLQSEFR